MGLSLALWPLLSLLCELLFFPPEELHLLRLHSLRFLLSLFALLFPSLRIVLRFLLLLPLPPLNLCSRILLLGWWDTC